MTFAAAGIVFACSSSDSGGGAGAEGAVCADHAPLGTAEPATAAVSFTRDVLPVFERSCTFSSCHGNVNGDNHGVYLGNRGGGSDAAKVRASLVDQASTKLPKMALVKAGDPSASFLVRKLDGDTCSFDHECSDGSCGERMPRGGDALDTASRAAIRAWIEGGATQD